MDAYLEQLLSAYWLRPETALWRAIDIRAMERFKFASPSLDMGCGDGVFSFIRAGGEFDAGFDVFRAVSNLDKYFDKVDIYNSFNGRVKPIIRKEPAYAIDVGFDHKDALLKKAGTLGLYKKCTLGDANSRLPFDGSSFNTVFSNIVYWLNDPAHVFAEIHRILKPGGQICVLLPNSTLPEFSFYHELCVVQKNDAFKFLEQLDRGRLSDNIKHAKTGAQWIDIMERAGLRIREHRQHLSKTIVQIWDIGLRPLFPVLLKMVSKLKEEDAKSIKSEWVEIFLHFLEPIASLDRRLNQDCEPAFHCFIAEKPR